MRDELLPPPTTAVMSSPMPRRTQAEFTAAAYSASTIPTTTSSPLTGGETCPAAPAGTSKTEIVSPCLSLPASRPYDEGCPSLPRYSMPTLPLLNASGPSAPDHMVIRVSGPRRNSLFMPQLISRPLTLDNRTDTHMCSRQLAPQINGLNHD